MILPLLLTLACSGTPDPDALLRTGDLDGAAAAWKVVHGTPLDTDHPVAHVLAMRAPRDPAITVATIADTVGAVRFLEQAPLKRTEALDLTIERLADLGAALDTLAEPPALVVVGRSENLADRDPYTTNAPLPWKGGRILGIVRSPSTAADPFARLGAGLDADPPPKLVVIGVSDATGVVYLNLERQGGLWAVLAASDADAGARLVLAADAVRDYGAPTLRERQGRGFVRR